MKILKKFIRRPKKLSQSAHFDKTTLLAVLAALVLVGTVIIFRGRAAGPFASIDLGSGSNVASPAVVASDQAASGGSYVQFGGQTQPPSGGVCPAYPAFPDASCTGWQHTGVTLSTYTGPCTITQPTVIDSKIINCGLLLINSTGVKVTRSKLNGTIFTHYHINYNPTFTDVEINGGKSIGACIGPLGGTYTRINVYGCSQGMQMQGFTLVDSYFHDLHGGPDGPCQPGVNNAHGAGVAAKYSSASTPNIIIHNRIIANNLTYDPWCSVPPAQDYGGVSGAVTMYTHGDTWGNQSNIHFEKNFLAHGDGSNDRRDFASYCLYAGSTTGTDGQGISDSKFFDNVFDRNPASPENPDLCGFGGAVTHSIKSNVCWSNNKYETGEQVSVPGTVACNVALLSDPQPSQTNVLVEHNLFNTQTGGYCLYAPNTSVTNVRIINNRFGRQYNQGCGGRGPIGSVLHQGNGNIWSGSVWDDVPYL